MNNNTNGPAGKMRSITYNDISLPKGGGAIRSMGEAYKTNLFSGTGSYTIPLPVTPARGFEPELNLEYNSSAGNSGFGLGFSLLLSEISVNAEKRIPCYDGSDGFTMTGQGELVLKKSTVEDPNPYKANQDNDNYEVSTYLPRIEAAFSKIEQWKKEGSDDSYWKVTSRENVISYFGRSAASRVYNPADPVQVFEWLLEESIDPNGNRIVYTYKEENEENVPETVYEEHRSCTAQRYIHSIEYGNYVKQDGSGQAYAFTIIFDYGEYDISNPLTAWTPVQDWSCRPDPFSSYRSGFEIRTFRLCRNILLFHCFEKELGDPFLVKASTLAYDNQESYDPIRFNGMSKLKTAGLSAFRKASEDTFEKQDFPSVEFGWSEFNPPEQPEFKTLTSGGYTIPGFIGPQQFFPVDMNGDGIPGLLYTDGQSVMYLEPEGNGKFKRPLNAVKFPVNRKLGDGIASIQDLDGNGEMELVVVEESKAGFYQSEEESSWQNFQPFDRYPIDYANPLMETADLSGCGKSDLLLVGKENIRIYNSAGKKGYDRLRIVENTHHIPANPGDNLVEHVGFADIFGDGLPHRVRVRNGSVECWPCLGYGNFGEVVTLGNAPDFGADFDVTRLFFTDLDGSGTADMIYVQYDRVVAYLNQSGNSFSEPIVLYLPVPFSKLDQINFADILGNGTTCLVFTKIATDPVQYWYNFAGASKTQSGEWMQRIKPYLLCNISDNLGTSTTIKYNSSSQYAMEDKLRGRPWPVMLPFPVQVVAEISTYDQISAISTVNRFAWHDGYYDPEERAFRGFGYVESWDATDEGNDKNSPASIAPVYTRSWYLTGACVDYDILLAYYRQEYFNKDKEAINLPDSFIDPLVYQEDNATLRQAYTSLTDKLIRREVYGLDNASVAENPYTVEESNYSVIMIQAAHKDGYGVYRVDSRERIVYNYERDPADPGTIQEFTLEVDPLCGEVTKSCTVYLSRRDTKVPSVTIYPEQQVLKATANARLYINTGKQQAYRYRGIQYDQQELELLQLDIGGGMYFSYEEIKKQAAQAFAHVMPYLGNPTAELTGPYASQLSWTTAYFWNEDQSEALSAGEISSRALLHHQAQAIYTKDNINMFYGDRLSEDVILEQGGYLYNGTSGYYENCGLVQYYFSTEDSFFMPSKVENSFADPGSRLFRRTTLEYDPYFFAVTKSLQYVDEKTENVTTSEIDYQVMQPRQIIDINSNVNQALYDPFGKVIASSVFGKEDGASCGAMRLYEYGGQPAEYIRRDTASGGGPVTFDDVINNAPYYLQGAASFFFYDLHAYESSLILQPGNPQPLNAISLERYSYYYLNGGITPFNCRTEVEFSDGHGKIIEKKMRVEAGLAITRDKKGNLMRHSGKIRQDQTDDRWLVSGRTVYNNKGLVAEQYLAYFSNSPYYEAQEEITTDGLVPPPARYYYDPLQRPIREDTPKGFFTKTQYTAWEEAHFDEDDTVLDSAYYKWFMANYPANPTQAEIDEKNALEKAAHFFNTPVIYVQDNAAHRIREIQTEEGGRQLVTFTEEDMQGRKILLIDPRLFLSNFEKGTDYYSFKYSYPMGEKGCASSNSADAGLEVFFNNIFADLCWSLSARNYCQLVTYDRLNRKSSLSVKQIDYSGPVIHYEDFNLVEVFTYGETQPDAEQNNLRGELYQQKDLSGINLCLQYNMRGNLLSNSRQVVKDYKTPADWKNTVELEPELYPLSFTFDALGDLLTESTPDGSVTSFQYNMAGLLDQIVVTGKDNFEQELVNQIAYDANRQRTKIRYGNGIQTTYTYEWTTQRLARVLSTRQSTEDPIVQDINYTYDPVGNLTRSVDNSIETVFFKNQQVDPMSDYTYDALYRLINANGRQHPGINANTYKNNAAQGSFKQSIFSQLPASGDGTALENYIETYTYDDSGNLVHKTHTAASASFSVDAPVEDNNNHLKEFEYDACGNQRQIAINNTVALSFNCCENLVRTGIIERPDEADDADYYVYDGSEDRILKVSERSTSAGAVTEISRKTYIGNYEVTQQYQVVNNVATLTMERRTLRVMDDKTCVAILHYWELDDKNQKADKTGTRSIRFQMDNGNGSISMEMDTGAKLISYEEYFPFGGTAIIAGGNELEVALKEYRYSGKECDDSTGLYYYGARYFISWLGRWLNADPLGDADGLNLFTYVSNNPFRYKDPDGLSKKRKANWDMADSQVQTNVTQNDLTGRTTGRQSWYPTGTSSVTSAVKKNYVTSPSGVVAILKVNGVALQTGKNGAASNKLKFRRIGTENQKGLKINPHAEDWSLSSFRTAYSASKTTLPTFLTGVGAPASAGNTGDAAGKPVFSLRINFSPCLGCVGTIISFKEFLDSELGAGKYIFRTKFLRPYDLPSTLTSSTSSKATNFWDAMYHLEQSGIPVRIQPLKSAQAMTPKLTLAPTEDFGQPVIKTLFPVKYAELTQTWKQKGVSRTK